MEQPCDICGAPVVWTPEQVQLDVALRLSGYSCCTGLGVMCDTCGDKQAALDAELIGKAA